MKHLIIGKGNLGMDIGIMLRDHLGIDSGDVTYMSKSAGFQYKEHIAPVAEMDFTHLWIAAGGVSVGEAKLDLKQAVETLYDMPMAFLRQMKKEVYITVFSSDYAYDPERSMYGKVKRLFHDEVIDMNRPRTCMVGVSSLYGKWYPQRSFPGKILKGALGQTEMRFPTNKVTPTPTDFVALNLVNDLALNYSENGLKFLNMCPNGSISTYGWAQLILQDFIPVLPSGMDPERPEVSHFANDKCKFSWSDLWKIRQGWFDDLREELRASQGMG